VFRHGNKTLILTFGCPELDKSPVKSPARTGSDQPAAAAKAADTLTVPSFCPADPGEFYSDRFDMCLYVQITVRRSQPIEAIQAGGLTVS
jgi:hypothetical protein